MANRVLVSQLVLVLVLVSGLGACRSAGDETVSLSVTGPVTTSTLDTTDAIVDIVGTAQSDNGILRVLWASDRGTKGIAEGTDQWRTGAVALELGRNVITITAEGRSGATTNRRVTVNRESGEIGSVSLAWEAPTRRADGSALTDLAGYRIYYGRMSGIYDYEIEIDNPGTLAYVVENLVPGDWYFAVAAFDSKALESDYSNELSRVVL